VRLAIKVANYPLAIHGIDVIVGLEGVDPQLAANKRGVVNMGNSQELVDELCAWLDHEGWSL